MVYTRRKATTPNSKTYRLDLPLVSFMLLGRHSGVNSRELEPREKAREAHVQEPWILQQPYNL